MKKLKVYLDTSVISYLLQDDAPEKMQETRALWEMFEEDKYDVFLSQVTLDELNKCHEPKKSVMADYLKKINYTLLELTPEVLKVTNKIIEDGILSPKSITDCQHIAAAVVNGCDCILSWNFKHMVNLKTIRGVRKVAEIQGYESIDIIQPTALLGGEE